MVFLAKGFVAATPLIVRGISGNLMVAAAPAVVSGSAGIMRGIFNTDGVKGQGADRCAHDRRSDRTRGRSGSSRRAERRGNGERAGGTDGREGEAAGSVTRATMRTESR